MVPLVFIIAGLAFLGVSGCAAVPKRRENYPLDPPPDDSLANDPCSIKEEPEIVFENPESSPEFDRRIERAVREDLDELKRINPAFVCGLERIEFLSNAQFSSMEDNPDAVAHYDTNDRIIRMSGYSSRTLFHEMGHHLHNLGILAPTVRGLGSIKGCSYTQNWKQLLGPRDPCFITPYAGKNFHEDWAETFSFAALNPVGSGARFYLQPRMSGEDTPLRRKLDIVYRDLPVLRFPSEPARIEIGDSVSLPSSVARFADGDSLYLYRGDGLWSGYNLASQKMEGEVEGMNFNEIPSNYLMGRRVGPYLIAYSNENYFDRTSYAHKKGMHIIDSRQGLSRMSMEANVIGEFDVQGDRLLFFRKVNGTPHALEQRVFDPSTGASQLVRRWAMPADFTPRHVTRLNGDDLAVFGDEGRERFRIIRISRDPASPDGFSVRQGGAVRIPSGFENSFILPFRQDGRLLFPLNSFHFISYDLQRDEFALVDPKINRIPSEFESLQLIVPHRTGLYAVGEGRGGETLVAPMKFAVTD